MAVRDTGRGTVFDFRMSRGREGPAQFLGKFEGILQTDDYSAYERGIGGPKMVHASCWSHAGGRRCHLGRPDIWTRR
jgi:transposase